MVPFHPWRRFCAAILVGALSTRLPAVDWAEFRGPTGCGLVANGESGPQRRRDGVGRARGTVLRIGADFYGMTPRRAAYCLARFLWLALARGWSRASIW